MTAPDVSPAATAREAADAWESLFRTQVTLMRRLRADDIWGDLSMREYDVLFTLASAAPAPGEAAQDGASSGRTASVGGVSGRTAPSSGTMPPEGQAPAVPMRLRDLNEGILMAQSSLSRMVERLEARGLVERTPDPGDGRGTLVGLTPAGERAQKELGRRHVRSIARYVGGALDSDELATLRTLLDRLRAAQSDIPDA